MIKALTFIIPVRHHHNSKNWTRHKAILAETICSIAQQTSNNWRAIVVANNGADLPTMPDGFQVARVDFPPNELHDEDSIDREKIYDAVRFDKGRRVLAGMLFAGKMQHVMIVDDDDFVSNALATYVSSHSDQFGWYLRDGYVWSEGTHYLYRHSDFSGLCGTSLIIKKDLYCLPEKFEDASNYYIKKMLGSHIFIKDHLNEMKTPLKPLPFIGAVYRVGHSGAHSKSKGVIAEYFLRRWLLSNRAELLNRILRLKLLSKKLRCEYLIK